MSEGDNWSTKNPSITAPETLATIKAVLEEKGPVILEHWHYRGASAPSRMVFDDYEPLLDYLTSRTIPGDDIWLWDYAALCRNDNRLASGKIPDAQGRTPATGAY